MKPIVCALLLLDDYRDYAGSVNVFAIIGPVLFVLVVLAHQRRVPRCLICHQRFT